MLFRFATNGSARFLFPSRARFYVVPTPLDLRARLSEELKNSLKGLSCLHYNSCVYDVGWVLTRRLKEGLCMPRYYVQSVLSEVYSADKVSNGSKVDSSAIATLIRRACTRRLDSADQFNQASRPDLAAKERQEADFLAKFLPPLLPEAEIDRILKGVIISQRVAETQVDDPRRSIGKVFKTFYAKVDRASVDPDLVRRRAEALLAAPPFA